MGGVFTEWQPRYAEHGIFTFPVEGKKPAIRGYLNVGPRLSQQLARNFTEHNALGFALGKSSRLTVLDVDTPDERLLADALARHGTPPILVKTGSGRHQAWYRFNGELRKVRPWPNQPIDVLGAGYVIAPPSRGARRCYQFIQGSLDDLDSLPFLVGADECRQQARPTSSNVRQGARNNALWRHCMKGARYCDTFDDLLDVARTFNEQSCLPPLDDNEVVKVARSAWGYTERGENRFGQVGAWFPADEANSLIRADSDAFVLLGLLRANNRPGRHFMIANGLAEEISWGRKRLAAARKKLIECSYIEQVRAASAQTGPALFRWREQRGRF
jgi:hypothetical protein